MDPSHLYVLMSPLCPSCPHWRLRASCLSYLCTSPSQGPSAGPGTTNSRDWISGLGLRVGLACTYWEEDTQKDSCTDSSHVPSLPSASHASHPPSGLGPWRPARSSSLGLGCASPHPGRWSHCRWAHTLVSLPLSPGTHRPLKGSGQAWHEGWEGGALASLAWGRGYIRHQLQDGA